MKMMDNAGISYADLGKKTVCFGRDDSCTHQKITGCGHRKGTKLNVDIKALGYDVIAFIGIYLEKSSLYDNVAKELRKIPEIVRA